MTVRITPFSTSAAPPRYSFGGVIPILAGQSADRIDLTGSGVQNSVDFATDTIVAISVTADCYIRVGVAAIADAAKAEPWSAGTTDFRFVRAGERISTFS